MKKIICLFFVAVFLLCGCSIEDENGEKLKDLEFTVVEEGEVPEELTKIIEDKKTKEFKITYSDGTYLYIVVGYGEQATGGYSVAVNQLYLSDNAIYLDTNLIGPSKDEKISQVITYPSIVLKLEYLEKSVVFQ